MLEELYYHTKEDSRYISELKKALVDSGIYEAVSYTHLDVYKRQCLKSFSKIMKFIA